MIICYLNNVYMLFLPAYTSHVFQSLDLGCFSSLKSAYRRFLGEYTALTDSTKVGKARFLEFYAKAREIGLREENIRSGWKATGLYPKNVAKPLKSRWVVKQKRPATLPPTTSDISTPKRGGDIIKLFAEKNNSPTSRLSIRKAANALDKIAMDIILKDREIERLREELAKTKPPKRQKIQPEPNKCFASLTEVLAQANYKPPQRRRKPAQNVVVDGSGDSSESENEQVSARRSARDRRPTDQFLNRDLDADDESD